MRSITILGAGLVGSLLSVLLRKKGYEVTIYERRPDMRKEAIGAGKSINLAMSVRGWKALELAGLRQQMEKIAIPMYGRYLHQADGNTAFQQYSKNNEAIYSISRGDLNKNLMTIAEEAGVKIIFNERCVKVDIAENRLTLQNATGTEKAITADLLIGADGAFSALRHSYTLTDRVNASQHYIEYGYKELNIPAGRDGKWGMEKNALHIWPRKNYMLIALPNIDCSFTCTLFFPFEGEPSFASLKNENELKQFFQEHFADAVPLMPTLLTDFFNNPTASLVTTHIYPWKHKDKSFLIGDAAHAIVPFYGQGMNAGFEDCTTINNLMNAHGEDWATILEQYQQIRKPNGDAVATLALNNFIEMRDKVADETFLQRKKIEKELGKLYPDKFISVYEMVSFSHLPYSKAFNCIKAQDALLEKIMDGGDFTEKMKDDMFRKKVSNWMNDYHSSIS